MVDASVVEEAVRVMGGGGGGGVGAVRLEDEVVLDFVGEDGISERGDETDGAAAAAVAGGGGGRAVEVCSFDADEAEDARVSFTGEGSFEDDDDDGSDVGRLFPSRREVGALETEASTEARKL